MGGFCLGSTIALVFGALSDFEFKVRLKEKAKVAQRLGDAAEKSRKLSEQE
jgi:hypothetical protein